MTSNRSTSNRSTTNRTPRRTRVLRLFRPAAPLVGLLDGDRDSVRQQSDLRAVRAHQLPEG